MALLPPKYMPGVFILLVSTWNTGEVGALKCDSDSPLGLKSLSEIASRDVEHDPIGQNPNSVERSLGFRQSFAELCEGKAQGVQAGEQRPARSQDAVDLREGLGDVHVRQRDIRDHTIEARSRKGQPFRRRTNEGSMRKIDMCFGKGRELNVETNNLPT